MAGKLFFQQKLPSSILFICRYNAIRSVMAEGLMKARFGQQLYVQSCGLSGGEVNDYVVSVMAEKGLDLKNHHSRTLEELADTNFDMVIAFSEDAKYKAEIIFADKDTYVEYWPIAVPQFPSLDVGVILDGYRALRDNLDQRFARRFLQE